MDHSHNPEFTTCELYQAYGTFESLISFTEELVYGLARLTNDAGQGALPPLPSSASPPSVDCKPPFRRINFVDELELQTGEPLHPLLSAASLGDEAAEAALVAHLLRQCQTHGLSDAQPHTSAALLDRLCGHFVEPQCVDPTFITHHPLCMSPLAKADPEKVGECGWKGRVFLHRKQTGCHAMLHCSRPNLIPTPFSLSPGLASSAAFVLPL